MSKPSLDVDDILESLGEGPEDINLDQVAALLRRMSTDSHEARLEMYAVDGGCALCFGMVPREKMAPDYLRRRPGDSLN